MCIAGATTTFAVVANKMFPRRSSANPAEYLAIKEAVAGATMTRSAFLAKSMCLTDSISLQRSDSIGFLERASSVAAPMNLSAFWVATT